MLVVVLVLASVVVSSFSSTLRQPRVIANNLGRGSRAPRDRDDRHSRHGGQGYVKRTTLMILATVLTNLAVPTSRPPLPGAPPRVRPS